MSFQLNDFANTNKWTVVTTGTAEILNRTANGFQIKINASTDMAWLVTTTPVNIRNIDLSVLMDLMTGGTFLYIGNSPPDPSIIYARPSFTIIRTRSPYAILVYNGSGFPWADGFPNGASRSPTEQVKVGWLVDTAGLLHGYWADIEFLNANMPIADLQGLTSNSCYIAIGALAEEHGTVLLGTSTFTAVGAVIPPLAINITPTSASLLVGQSQAFHANVTGGTVPTVTWYQQGNATPLGTGTDINLSFQASGTFTIYAIASDPTAPNSPLQSNNSIVTVTAESYTLTITAGIGGTTNPPPGTYQETSGSNVILTAIPSQGYVFDHWTTDDSNNNSESASITVTMNTNHNVAAVFAVIPPNQFNLIMDSSPIGGIEVTVTKN